MVREVTSYVERGMVYSKVDQRIIVTVEYETKRS